jgi:hypothetical protein
LTRLARFAGSPSRRIASRPAAECRSLETSPQKTAAQEAAMTGLILLLFLGVLVGFGWTRVRGKMKLGISGKHWAGAITVFVLIVLMLYASHNGH